MPNYKNVIFDLGGVVVEYAPKDFLMDHFMNRSTEEIVYALTFGSQEWEDMDRGVLTRGAGNRIMLQNAARCGRTFEVQTVIDEWTSILKTKKRTIKTMCALKMAGYRLYYLSNIPSDIFAEISSRDFFPLFDGGLTSFEAHINKPDPAIYTALMQKCHLAYDESIFVDDSKANAQAAFNLGITGILYKNHNSFNRALGLCGIVLPQRRGRREPNTAAAVAAAKQQAAKPQQPSSFQP